MKNVSALFLILCLSLFCINVDDANAWDLRAGNLGTGTPDRVWKTDGAGVGGWRIDQTSGTPYWDQIQAGVGHDVLAGVGTISIGNGTELDYIGSGLIDASSYQGEDSITPLEFGRLTGVTQSLSNLNSISVLGASPADSLFIVGTGSGWTGETGATVRTSLGLGTLATQAANSVAITGGAISGITDLAIADGGTASSDAPTARTNLGLAIGSDVQGYNTKLTNLVTTNPANANLVWQNDGSGIPDWRGLTLSFSNLGSGTNLGETLVIGNGSSLNYTGTGTINAYTYRGVTTISGAEFGYLNTVSSNIQTQFTGLSDFTGLQSGGATNNNFIVGNGANWTKLTPTLSRTALGLGTIATQNSNNVTITGGSISGVSLSGTIAVGDLPGIKDVDFIPIGWAQDGLAPPDTIENLDANNGSVQIRKFDDTLDQDVIVPWVVPSDFSGTTVSYRIIYYISETTAPGAGERVDFGLKGAAIADGESLDVTYGTPIETFKSMTVTDIQNDVMYTGWSSNLTITGIAAGKTAVINVYRDANDATNDTYDQKVGVMGIEIKYSRTFTDS